MGDKDCNNLSICCSKKKVPSSDHALKKKKKPQKIPQNPKAKQWLKITNSKHFAVYITAFREKLGEAAARQNCQWS